MQNRTCSCGQTAERFNHLYPDIIQFLRWVINIFKPPFTTAPVNFCIVENISVLILHIISRYLEMFKPQSIFLIYVIGICEDTSGFLPVMFATALSPVWLVAALGCPDCSTVLPPACTSALVVTCLIGMMTVCHLYWTACGLHKQKQQVALCLSLAAENRRKLWSLIFKLSSAFIKVSPSLWVFRLLQGCSWGSSFFWHVFGCLVRCPVGVWWLKMRQPYSLQSGTNKAVIKSHIPADWSSRFFFYV
jgi:hypothetical protein